MKPGPQETKRGWGPLLSWLSAPQAGGLSGAPGASGQGGTWQAPPHLDHALEVPPWAQLVLALWCLWTGSLYLESLVGLSPAVECLHVLSVQPEGFCAVLHRLLVLLQLQMAECPAGKDRAVSCSLGATNSEEHPEHVVLGASHFPQFSQPPSPLLQSRAAQRSEAAPQASSSTDAQTRDLIRV